MTGPLSHSQQRTTFPVYANYTGAAVRPDCLTPQLLDEQDGQAASVPTCCAVSEVETSARLGIGSLRPKNEILWELTSPDTCLQCFDCDAVGWAAGRASGL